MCTSEKNTCCVRGCSSEVDKIAHKLFVFPPDTNPRAKTWLELYPHSFLRKRKEDNYICARHFTADYLNESGELLDKAIPSVNIDTSYAQEMIMRTFIMKVIYEWILRNSIEAYTLVIWQKVLEAKVLLGMQIYTLQHIWISKFIKFKFATQRKGDRFGSGQEGPKNLLDIIKDIRGELPSNFSLPCDNIGTDTPGEEALKVSDDGLNSVSENENSTEAPIQNSDVVPTKSLNSYQEALQLLKPLKEYIKRNENKNASVRLSEIESIIKQVIKNESKPKRAAKRKR